MPPAKSDIGKLVGENLSFQQKEWRVDRAGWLVMALILVAGLFGVWGGGLVGDTTTTSDDGSISVSYDRFVRNLGQSELMVVLPPGSAEEGTVQVALDQEYLTGNQVESVTPEPDSVTAQDGRFVYEFPTLEDTSLTVRFDLRPNAGTGVRTATVDGGSGGQVRLWQFVYP